MVWGLRAVALAALWALLLVSPGYAQLVGSPVSGVVGTALTPTTPIAFTLDSESIVELVDENEVLFGLTIAADGSISGTPTSAGENTEVDLRLVRDGVVMAISSFPLTIALAVPTFTFTDSAPTLETAVGQDVTFTVTLTGGYNPTGPVTFSTPMFGTLATVPVVDGVAAYTTSSLYLGSWVITAVYFGDENNEGNVGTLVHTVSVNGPPPPPPPPEPDTEDSENLDLVQNRFVPLIALQSGGSIGDAIGNAANFGLNSGSATQFDGTGGFMAYAPEPAAPAALRNILIEESPDTFGLSVWIDARGKGLLPGTDAARDGWQANLTTGAGVRIGDGFVVGGLAGYEQFSYTDTDPAGTLSGSGASIGGYGGVRIGDGVNVNFGLVYTDLSYEATSGTASGTFGATRLLLTGGISGSMALGGVTVTPSARIFGLREQSEAYVDTMSYAHDARDILTGEASAGLEVSGTIALSDDWQLTPRVGAFVDARSDGTILVDDLVETVGGRIALGAELGSMDGAVLSLDGEIAGLGTDTLTWSATGSLKSAF